MRGICPGQGRLKNTLVSYIKTKRQNLVSFRIVPEGLCLVYQKHVIPEGTNRKIIKGDPFASISKE